MKKGLIFLGLGLILGPLFADLLLVLGLLAFAFFSGASMTAIVVTVSVVGTIGGALCIALTIILMMVGIVMLILGAVMPSKNDGK